MKTLTSQCFKILSVCLLLMVFNCQRDDTITTQDTTPIGFEPQGKTIEVVSFSRARNFGVIKYLEDKLGTTSRHTESNILDIGIGTVNLSLGEGRVFEDSGKTVFTFPVIPYVFDTNSFYNLIVSQDNQGDILSSYIRKYEMESSFATDYRNGSRSLSEFTGTIYKYSIVLNTQRGGGDDGDGLLEECPDDDFVDGNNNNTNGGGSSGDGHDDGNTNDPNDPVDDGGLGGGDSGGNGPGNQDCTLVEYVKGCGGTNSSTFHPLADCYYNSDLPVTAEVKLFEECVPNSQRNLSRGVGEEECPREVIVVDLTIISALNESLEPDLTPVQIDWIFENEENLAFALEALETLENGGKVDFENKIIKDSNFIDTDAECVLDELTATGNNIFKQIADNFTQENSEFRIRFTVEESPSDSPAHTSLPEDTGIISIKIDPDYVNGNAIDLANIILHEIIHAELHRIFVNNNEGLSPFPETLFNWYMDLWEYYNNGVLNDTATDAEHSYMAAYYTDNIAQGLQEFDENAQTLSHYLGFAWTGLSSYGINGGYITPEDFNNFLELSNLVYTDTHTNDCD